jgi:hypothetical protein
MTRREFVIQTYGKNVANDDAFGGIWGCPNCYNKLIEVDRTIASEACLANCVKNGSIPSNEVCAKCWNQEIPEMKKTRSSGFRLEKVEKAVKEADLSIKEAIDRAVCDCDTCAHQDVCRFECQFRGMTKEMYRHCIEETVRYNIPELGIQMRPLHCKRYEPSPAIEELNTAVFHLKAQNLTDEMVRKIFDEENKQWTL